MAPDLSVEELATVLDRRVAQLLERADVAAPPVDALRVAAAVGLVIARDDRQSGRARLVRLPAPPGGDGASILLRSDPRVERRQWAVAHELGELEACAVYAELGLDPRAGPPSARERIANYLAGRLLLPSEWFAAAAAECDWDLPALKARFSTASHELIARRMLDFPARVIITIFDQGRGTFRGGNGPGRVPAPTAVEIRCWSASRGGQPASDVAWPLRTRAWPIHEPQWRREILRTEIEEDA